MSINQLIFRSLKKNLKNYYLYVFALIFSVALYFSFVTLRFDPAMDPAKGSIRGAAGIKAAAVLLVCIVAVFLLYANQIFIKRRSQEIGLFQLIGLTKNRIFRMLTLENLIIYFGSLIAGVFVGFAISKLMTMILFHITGVEAVAALHFSTRAVLQTLLIFSGIFILIMLTNLFYIKRQSILALFQVKSTSQGKAKKMSVFEIILGILGLVLITAGYYTSSKLFDGQMISMLLGVMLFILASVILGTYLFYKGSVQFIGNMIRKKRQGYLNINEVMSLSPIMFRMKSNALLLTVITTVSALAIGLLSLSYIAYYSAEKNAESMVAADFAFTQQVYADQFKEVLKENGIPYSSQTVQVLQYEVNAKQIMNKSLNERETDPGVIQIAVISEKSAEGIDVKAGETIFTGFSDLTNGFLDFDHTGSLTFKGKKETIPMQLVGTKDKSYVSGFFTNGSLPVAVVDSSTFQQLYQQRNKELQTPYKHIPVNITASDDIEKANTIFDKIDRGDSPQYSKLEHTQRQKKALGLSMFIVGFLGLTFLITSGCVLYFKQMDEGEEEKASYTILRKLGFTQRDLIRGIQGKQLFNFGIPLIVGLSHSYFAVKSGWFIFGTELWTPMIIVMGVYTALYSIFGILSTLYYKKIIQDAL
ncbi:ABC transporter permease [Halobacillus rhizosphaerae]|uniref:ABC transporter permease n=1 Tax=Halobacillus rhizosphaerae TaxID=3064889 RepID=UPI00398AF0DC